MRTRRAGYNAIAYAGAFILNAFVTFLSSPILLEELGATVFGVWKTLQKIFDIVSVTDGRSGQALKMIIARAEGNSSDQLKKEAIGAAIIIWILYLPIAVFTLVGLYFYLPQVLGLNGTESFNKELIALFFLLSINLFIAPLIGIPDAVLMGINQGYKSIIIQVMGMIASTLSMVVLVVMGFGLKELGEVTLICTIFVSIIILIFVKKAVPWFAIKIPSKNTVKIQGCKTFFMNLWMLVEKILLSSDMVLIGALCSPAYVASYSFMTYVPQMATSLILIIGASITPGLASMLASNQDDNSKRIINVFREVVLMLGTLFASLYVLFNKSFISIWVGDKVMLSQEICILIGLSIFQISHARSEAQLQDTMLVAKSRVLIGMLGAISGLTLSFIFTQMWPVNAILALLIGGFIGRLIITIVYPIITNRHLNKKGRSTRAIFVSLFIFTLASVASFFVPSLSIVWLVSFGVISLLILVLVCFYLILSTNTREYFFLKFQPRENKL